ncbi:MAG: septum site-determining protein MinC [Synergistaceae bacterium]|nr:septum site-determining protein MinC [Synergistaceae bacterium]
MLRCVIPEELPPSGLGEAFMDVMNKGRRILPGARLILDFGARPLPEPLIGSILSDFVWPSGVHVLAWVTYDAGSQETLKRAGLPVSEPSASIPDNARSAPALVLHRSLRSGQRVEHRGDVVITGHVNGGAEVMASGNITALGRLKGLVHAGYEGNERAVVVARSMEALQVRIGGKIGSLDRGSQCWGRGVIISVADDRIQIDYWPQLKNETGWGNAD